MTDILILGGGFAGFWAALAARRTGGSQVRVCLASRDEILQMRPRLYEAEPQTHGIDLRPFLNAAGVDFLAFQATDLDVGKHALAFTNGQYRLYKRLIVATGSAIRRPPVPGADTLWTIDDQKSAMTFDRQLAQIARERTAPHIVVVGAGFTGIELALELRDRVVAHKASEAAERMAITLIDSAAVVGPELGPGPRPLIEEALAASDVKLLLGAVVVEFAPDRVTLADGSAITADAVVLTTGMEASGFAKKVPGERDELGRVIVDRSLRALAAPDVFVAGDAAAADCGDGHQALQSCQHALQSGRFAGENAARDLLGLPLLSFTPEPYVTCLDLGRAGAVLTEGWDRQISLKGSEAKMIKQQINRKVIYPPQGLSPSELLERSSTDPALQGEDI